MAPFDKIDRCDGVVAPFDKIDRCDGVAPFDRIDRCDGVAPFDKINDGFVVVVVPAFENDDSSM